MADDAQKETTHRLKGWRVWIEYFARQWKAPNKRGMGLRYTLRERFLCSVRMARAARLIHNGPPYR